MTLAKTCLANNMMQNFKKQLDQRIAITEAFWIAMFQYYIVVFEKKLNLILKVKVAMLNE